VWSELKEEIELELAQLRAQFEIVAGLRKKVNAHAPNAVEAMALAAFLHAFYNGVENAFKRVAIHFDEGPPRGNASHIKLLDRMAQASRNRPAVISDEVRNQLLRYLNFRHVFRHAYSFQLQWRKTAPLVLEVEDVFQQLEDALGAFLHMTAPRED